MVQDLTPVTIKRKLTQSDIEQMAELMAKRITETGACLMLNIKPQTWFNWKGKQKNAGKFTDILSRVRETKLKACLDTIDEAGEAYEVPTKNGSFMKPGDWRAKAWMAERVLAPDRLGDAQGQVQAIGLAQTSIDLISKVYANLEKARIDSNAIEAGTVEVRALPPVQGHEMPQDVGEHQA